jgi:hypothetical protein
LYNWVDALCDSITVRLQLYNIDLSENSLDPDLDWKSNSDFVYDYVLKLPIHDLFICQLYIKIGSF